MSTTPASSHPRPVAAVVAVAMPEEARPFLKALPHSDAAEPVALHGDAEAIALVAPSPAGSTVQGVGPRELLLVRSGIGLVAAASALATALTRVTPDVVVSAGTTGGLGLDDGGDVPVTVDAECGHAHGVGLVEVGGQPLAGAARVDEDECGAVGEHPVEDRVLDVRPDRGGHLPDPATAHGPSGSGGPSLPRHRLPQGAVGTPGLRMIAPPGTAGASPITSVVSAE